MSLSRKHYVAVAAILSEYTDNGTHTPGFIAEDLASYFASDNPAFDRQRFLKACGVEA